MTNVLVTGAGGYIGQRLIRHLAAGGMAVRALVRRDAQFPTGVDVVVGDLVRDRSLAGVLAKGVDTVVHLAGANEVAAATDPDGSLADTVVAAERVAASGVPRVIYLSTIHVYGDALRAGALVDEHTPTGPLHAYAAARLACEDVFLRSGVPSLIFRLTNGVGAPTHPDVRRWSLVANELCREAAVSGQVTLRTSGVQWRDFVALADVEFVVGSLVAPQTFGPGLYNFGSGTSTTVRTLATMIQDSFVAHGQPRPELVAPAAPDDPPGPYAVDVSKLAQRLDRPVTPLRRALDETVQFCIEHEAELR